MLNGVKEESLSDDRYKVKVENHSGATRKTFVTLSSLRSQKTDTIKVHAGTNDITNKSK